jgi:membrane-bound serine protease (ClpP class)
MKRSPLHLLILFAVMVVAGCGSERSSGGGEVWVARVDGEIGVQAAEYLERVVSEAEGEENVRAIVVELDTPGGRLDYTQEIIETMSNAGDLPVISYVSPQGARAASAGTFIVMGSDVAAMAPQTRLGAASPVDAFGRDIPGIMGDKVTNDAVALITGLAGAHGRNEEWAESAVREAKALDANEALEIGVVEHVEPSLKAVLEAADGERVEPKGITLRTTSAAIVQKPLSFRERFGVPLWVVAALGAALVVAIVLAAVLVSRTNRARISTGREGMIGEVGTVRRRVSGSAGGLVFVHGELWSAVLEDENVPPLEAGSEVEIVGFRRTAVVVRRAGEPS